jgi:hypothetical protein
MAYTCTLVFVFKLENFVNPTPALIIRAKIEGIKISKIGVLVSFCLPISKKMVLCSISFSLQVSDH